jgi:curved DNA-binding protein CbpA
MTDLEDFPIEQPPAPELLPASEDQAPESVFVSGQESVVEPVAKQITPESIVETNNTESEAERIKIEEQLKKLHQQVNEAYDANSGTPQVEEIPFIPTPEETRRFAPGVDYYEVLGVDHNASGKEIEKAMRDLTRKYHPDNPGLSVEQKKVYKEFQKKINEAYGVLFDDDERAAYNQAITKENKSAGDNVAPEQEEQGPWGPFTGIFNAFRQESEVNDAVVEKQPISEKPPKPESKPEQPFTFSESIQSQVQIPKSEESKPTKIKTFAEEQVEKLEIELDGLDDVNQEFEEMGQKPPEPYYKVNMKSAESVRGETERLAGILAIRSINEMYEKEVGKKLEKPFILVDEGRGVSVKAELERVKLALELARLDKEYKERFGKDPQDVLPVNQGISSSMKSAIIKRKKDLNIAI